MRKMTSVMDRTSIDRPKEERAGVPAGLKMLVGDCAKAAPAIRDELNTAPRKTHAGMLFILGVSVGECLVKGDKTV